MKSRVLLLLIMSLAVILAGPVTGIKTISAQGSLPEEHQAWRSETNQGSHQGKYATNHVIFNSTALKFYTSGKWAKYVRPQDSFMLVDGNGTRKMDTKKLNGWAKQVKSRHPKITIYAAASGIKNVRRSGGLDRKLFTGMIMVYEPNFQNAPEFKWDRKYTEKIWREAAKTIRSKGLKAGGKPSGRALAGRDKYGVWDYGALGKIMDVNNIQSQGSCIKNDFQKAMDRLVSQYQKAGAKSELLVQVSVGRNSTNSLPSAKAFNCAKMAWSKSRIDAVTLWPQTTGKGSNEVVNYLKKRESLLGK